MRCNGVDVYTLGFSNRTWEDTVRLLKAYSIELVVDVRSLPGSKRYPHFNSENLAQALPLEGIEYRLMRELGGYRKTQSEREENAGWRNASFRNYADYAQTEPFANAITKLISLSKSRTVVYCCTEAVPWRCHRSIISDFLLVHGLLAGDILSPTQCSPHKMTRFASVNGSRVTYPAEPQV